MTPKIQKIAAELDRSRVRLKETQERIRELERQKTELENTEIIALFRSLEVSPDQLPAFLAAMQAATLPEAEPIVSSAVEKVPHTPYTSGYTRNQEDENEE